MTNQLTVQQINWAKSHDWFRMVEADTGLLVVWNIYSDHNGLHKDTIIWNGSFKELRNWAGY